MAEEKAAFLDSRSLSKMGLENGSKMIDVEFCEADENKGVDKTAREDYDNDEARDTFDNAVPLDLNISPSKKKANVEKAIFGVDETEMKKTKALIRMGVTNEDTEIAERLMATLPKPINHKTEKLTGYRVSQMKRLKAVNFLGSSEEKIAEETAKKLSQLGMHRTYQRSLRRALSVPILSIFRGLDEDSQPSLKPKSIRRAHES